jgi:hypothetical protein
VARAAQCASVSERTAHKWLARHRAEGDAGLEDRSSAPRRVRRRIAPYGEARILAARRKRRTSEQIAKRFALPRATVARLLRRNGLSRLRALDPVEPVVRYERARPGELVHLDVKKLGRIDGVGHRIHGDYTRRARGVGWEFVHVAIDDKTRLAYSEVLPDERGVTATAFLERVALPQGLPARRDHGQEDPCVPSANQRQGRALHPDPDPRLGLRSTVPLLAAAHPRPARMAALLQHRTTPPSARRHRPPHLPPEVHLMLNNLLRTHT